MSRRDPNLALLWLVVIIAIIFVGIVLPLLLSV